MGPTIFGTVLLSVLTLWETMPLDRGDPSANAAVDNSGPSQPATIDTAQPEGRIETGSLIESWGNWAAMLTVAGKPYHSHDAGVASI
jgi:hypothetical protein